MCTTELRRVCDFYLLIWNELNLVISWQHAVICLLVLCVLNVCELLQVYLTVTESPAGILEHVNMDMKDPALILAGKCHLTREENKYYPDK